MTDTTVPVPTITKCPYPPGVEVANVMISPEVARQMLGYNTHNRNEKPVFQTRYAADMVAGNWTWTGEPIRFAADGTLIDGQNRLLALVAAEVTLPFLVIHGLPMEAQEDIDTGAARKFQDVLALRGEPNATHLAALVRRVAAWEKGRRSSLNSVVTSYHALSHTLERHPELRDIVNPSRKVADGCGLTGAATGLCMWVFQQIDQEDSDFFFARLGDGQGLVKGDPIFELRRTLHESNDKRKGARNETYLLAITVKAWNAYRNGETVGLYRWRPGGAKPEAFPEPA